MLQVSQQALRRLAPSEASPASRPELAGRGPVFTAYAERFGGYGSQRSLGIVFWLLANIADTMLSGDTAGAEELMALALISVEQAAQDNGSWDIGYLRVFRRTRLINCSRVGPAARTPGSEPLGASRLKPGPRPRSVTSAK